MEIGFNFIIMGSNLLQLSFSCALLFFFFFKQAVPKVRRQINILQLYKIKFWKFLIKLKSDKVSWWVQVLPPKWNQWPKFFKPPDWWFTVQYLPSSPWQQFDILLEEFSVTPVGHFVPWQQQTNFLQVPRFKESIYFNKTSRAFV